MSLINEIKTEAATIIPPHLIPWLSVLAMMIWLTFLIVAVVML